MIALLMPKPIVDGFEEIQIHDDDGEVAAAAMRPFDLVGEPSVEIASIENAGQRIGHAERDAAAVERGVSETSARELGQLREGPQVVAGWAAFVHPGDHDAAITALRSLRHHRDDHAHAWFCVICAWRGLGPCDDYLAAIHALAQPRLIAEHELLGLARVDAVARVIDEC